MLMSLVCLSVYMYSKWAEMYIQHIFQRRVYTVGHYHMMKENRKSNQLAKKLLTLDIDEGIRIESSIQRKRIFVNKNASDVFVVQLVVDSNNNSSDYDNNYVRYFDSTDEVIEFVNSHFQNRYTIVEY